MSRTGRRRRVPAECGFCGLEGPDEFGNWDLLEHHDCPEHGSSSRQLAEDIAEAGGGRVSDAGEFWRIDFDEDVA